MNADLRAKIEEWNERINEMSLRERGLMFVAVMVAVYLAMSTFVFAPLMRQQAAMEQELNTKRADAARLNTQIQLMLGHNDGNTSEAQRTAALREQLKQLDNSLGTLTKGLVSPQEMAKLVERMLRANRNLQVLKIESLAPTALLDEAGKSAAGVGVGDTLYKHGMRIQFRGGYGDIVNYLHALETLPWKMFWGEVQVVTEQHPQSTVTLVIYTLSLREAWIGV